MHTSASALRYTPHPDRNIPLRERIQALAHCYKRYGVGMIYLKLRQEGGPLNYKRVEQLYQEAKLKVRRRKRKKVVSANRCYERWRSMMSDRWTSCLTARPKVASLDV